MEKGVRCALNNDVALRERRRGAFTDETVDVNVTGELGERRLAGRVFGLVRRRRKESWICCVKCSRSSASIIQIIAGSLKDGRKPMTDHIVFWNASNINVERDEFDDWTIIEPGDLFKYHQIWKEIEEYGFHGILHETNTP